MKAEALTPADIFGYHVRYVVPLFQRPYVWNRADQWEPLWSDVATVAERLLATRPGPSHFLGAIVVEQAPTLVGAVPSYHVIDGQQRLTTLQVLLDAARRVIETDGDPVDAKALRLLVANETAKPREDELFKVWPTLADRDAYLAALTYPDPAGALATAGAAAAPSTAAPSAAAPLAASAAVAQAHAYFVEAITGWARAEGDAATAARLGALTRAISEHLRAVVIHLDPGDNAQGIFETLNHRGAPLLAADLIKNLVFRLAQAQGLDVVALYQRYWSTLDGPYWRAYVRRGRQVVPRIDIFVHYWLVMRVIEEVRTDQIFLSFRDHLEAAGSRIEDLLAELANDAETYRAIATPSLDTVPGRFCYRVFDAMDTGAVTPFYLWLMRWPVDALPTAQRDRALSAMESWVVRRWLCALPAKDTNGLVLDLLKLLDVHGPGRAGELTEAFLAGQRSASRVWPTDAAVRKALPSGAVDGRILRPRLRMLLEAIEDHRRTQLSEGTACERDLTVEHVMPLAWRQHWGTASLDAATAVLRDTLIHTLGNLTLVRYRLNAALANLPWTDAEASARGLGLTGKRTALSNHSLLKINAELVAANPDAWTEQSITVRTAALAASAVAVWSRPSVSVPGPALPVNATINAAAQVAVTRPPAPRAPANLDTVSDETTVDDADTADDETMVDDQTTADDETMVDDQATMDGEVRAGSADVEAVVTDLRSKYARLTAFLREQTASTIAMTFEQVEDVLGASLPPSARTSIPYWSRMKTALGPAIVAGGYRPSNVDLWNERVIFARSPVRTIGPVRRRPPGQRPAAPPPTR
jgi:hypothetical protein